MKTPMFFRIMAILLVCALLTALPAGCSKNELELFKTLISMNPVYSYESVGNAAFTLNIVPKAATRESKYAESVIRKYRMLQSAINGLKLDYSAKYSADRNYENIRQEILITPSMFGGKLQDLEFGLWSDAQEGKYINTKFIVKAPDLLMAAAKETSGKKYLTLDYHDIVGYIRDNRNAGSTTENEIIALIEKINYGQLMDGVNIAYMPFVESLIKAAAMMKPDEAYVSDIKPTTGEDSKIARVYTLQITDKGLKKLLRSAVNDVDQKTMRDVLTSFLKYLSYIYDNLYRDAVPNGVIDSVSDMIEELMQTVETEFADQYADLLPVINSLLDGLERIKILGPKGVKFDIEVNSEGYVTMYDGIIDFCFDVAAIERAGGTGYSNIDRVEFSVELFQKMTRVNKIVKIELPETTAKNSADVIKLAKDYINDNDGYDNYYNNYYNNYLYNDYNDNDDYEDYEYYDGYDGYDDCDECEGYYFNEGDSGLEN